MSELMGNYLMTHNTLIAVGATTDGVTLMRNDFEIVLIITIGSGGA